MTVEVVVQLHPLEGSIDPGNSLLIPPRPDVHIEEEVVTLLIASLCPSASDGDGTGTDTVRSSCQEPVSHSFQRHIVRGESV